jgi:hypothetical protein
LEQFQALAAFVVGGGEHHQPLLVVESDECLAVQEQVARPRVDHGLAVRSFDGHLVLGPHAAEIAALRLQPRDERGNLADAVVPALIRGRHGAPCYVTDGTPMPIRDFFTALPATPGC